MHPEEIQRVQNFLTTKFRGADIKLKSREETDDSVEFIIDGETMGIVFKDDEDGISDIRIKKLFKDSGYNVTSIIRK